MQRDLSLRAVLAFDPRGHLAKCAVRRDPPAIVWRRRNREGLARHNAWLAAQGLRTMPPSFSRAT